MRKPLPFGKYLLLDRVAVGGMAEVFAAKSFGAEGFERLVAIKRILPTMVEDDEFVAMFLDEARIAARLNHATIAQVYELGRHEETYYIAMEYVSGRDVRLIIDKYRKRNEAVPLPLAAYIMARISEGLDYAHSRTDENGEPLNIIHRDISPQNVLVSYDGEVKLIDFGIAKAAGRNQKTQVGILKGKFAYMSPEQVRGSDIDHRSDLYAVGVMLYEMITGAKLFSGESDFSTLEKVRAGTVRSPSELNPSITGELERVVLKALAKEREDRYQTGGDLSEDLMRYLYEAHSVFTSKSLAKFMGETFSDELRKENERMRRWWRTSAEETADFDDASPQPGKIRIGSTADIDDGAGGTNENTVVGAAGASGADGSTAIIHEGDIRQLATAVIQNPMLTQRAVSSPGMTPPPLQPNTGRSGAGRALAIAAGIIFFALAGGAAYVQAAIPGGVMELFRPVEKKSVVIKVTPSDGITAIVDGFTLMGDPPYFTHQGPGKHELRVSAFHYRTVERSFDPAKDSTVEIHLEAEPQAAPPTPIIVQAPPPPPPPAAVGATGHPGVNGTTGKVVVANNSHANPPPPPPPPPDIPTVNANVYTGTLILNTDPPGALAKVAGHMYRTPVKVTDIQPSKTIAVSFGGVTGYQKKEIVVSLLAGQEKTISEKLVPAPGSSGQGAASEPTAAAAPPVPTVNVICRPPGAAIFLDGKSTGLRTTARFVPVTVQPGHHSLFCQTDDGKTSPTKEYDIVAGQAAPPYLGKIQ